MSLQVVRMSDAPGVHELHHDFAVFFVNRVRNFPLRLRLFRRVETGDARVSFPDFGGRNTLCHNQSRRGTLGIIGGGDVGLNALHVGTGARHGCHNKPIFDFNVAVLYESR